MSYHDKRFARTPEQGNRTVAIDDTWPPDPPSHRRGEGILFWYPDHGWLTLEERCLRVDAHPEAPTATTAGSPRDEVVAMPSPTSIQGVQVSLFSGEETAANPPTKKRHRKKIANDIADIY